MESDAGIDSCRKGHLDGLKRMEKKLNEYAKKLLAEHPDATDRVTSLRIAKLHYRLTEPGSASCYGFVEFTVEKASVWSKSAGPRKTAAISAVRQKLSLALRRRAR